LTHVTPAKAGAQKALILSYYVYIMASGRNGTLYVGMTNDLIRRVYEHKHDLADGFTRKHRVRDLVYFEQTDDAMSAIVREKRLKKWNRKWKLALIEKGNPDWRDLYADII